MKEAANKGLVRPVLEFGSSVWDPHTHGLQEELEKVQNRAARFVTGNYVFETGSMTGILDRRKDSRLILLYKGLKGKARIPTDDLIPKTRRCRNQHSLAFQIPSASKEAYKSSFFPQTIRDWNDLPDSLISSAEMSDDCVQVCFTRAFKGLISPPSEPPGEIMSFGVSPVKLFRWCTMDFKKVAHNLPRKCSFHLPTTKGMAFSKASLYCALQEYSWGIF